MYFKHKVNSKAQFEVNQPRADATQRGRIMVFVLLMAVALLSTFAKDSLYLAKANAVHYVNIAAKMQVSYSPAVLDREPLQPVAKVAPPQPLIQALPQRQPEEPPVREIGVTVSIRHRSPPELFISHNLIFS